MMIALILVIKSIITHWAMNDYRGINIWKIHIPNGTWLWVTDDFRERFLGNIIFDSCYGSWGLKKSNTTEHTHIETK